VAEPVFTDESLSCGDCYDIAHDELDEREACDEHAEPKPDAAVLAYVCGNEVAYSWHNSMVQLIAFDAQLHARLSDGRGGFHGMRYGTGGLIDARNTAAYDFLHDFPDAQWLFWLDTDMGFPPETLELLLEAADPVERPIVGALCFSQQEIESDGMGGRRTQPTPVIYDWITVEGQSGYAVRWDYPRDTVTQTHATGSACIVIHRSVLERMLKEFGPVWYDRIPNPSTAQLFSEDLSFCVRAGALGIPVFVDTRVKTTHLKNVWVSEELYTRERVALALLERRPESSDGMKRVAMTGEQAWTFDLLPDALADLGVPATGVIHVGAHRGEEVPIYRKCGFEQITLVEPDPDNAAFLRDEFPDCAVIECAVGTEQGSATLHRADNTVFSGLKPDAGQPTIGSVEVAVRPLRDIQAEHPANVLVVDTQGTELEVLASADLTGVDLVVVETQELSRKMYAAFWPDAVEELGKAGFIPAIRWEHEQYFADTLFIRAPATDG
jgi:FkbM family methyltransferase